MRPQLRSPTARAARMAGELGATGPTGAMIGTPIGVIAGFSAIYLRYRNL